MRKVQVQQEKRGAAMEAARGARLFAVLGLCWLAGQICMAGDVDVYYWWARPDGQAAVGSGSMAGSEFDLRGDFGYRQSEPVLGLRTVVGERHQFNIDALRVDVSAEERIERNISFGGVLFPMSSTVESQIDAFLVRGCYRYRFVSKQAWSGGLSIGIQYADLSASAKATGVGSASEDIQAAMPVIGAFGQLEIGNRFTVVAAVEGSSMEFGDVSGQFLDIMGQVRWTTQNGIFLGAGYRYGHIDAEDKDVRVAFDIEIDGPVVVAGYAW